MKIILLFVFVITTVILFGQTSLSELRKLAQIDSDSFEVYVLERGYSHFKVINDERCKGVVYSYFDRSVTRYITSYTEYYSKPNTVNYQTNDQTEIIKYYNELKTFGFILESTDYSDENRIKKIYRKDKEEFQMLIRLDLNGYELAYSQL